MIITKILSQKIVHGGKNINVTHNGDRNTGNNHIIK